MMSAIPPDLASLRRRIDEIDDRLHDLLIERAEIVGLVAASKQNGKVAAYHPGREAQIIRRLAARHPGRFPLANLVRMWREMLAATLRQQAAFAVAVFAPPEAQGFWDLARDHYGSSTPMAAERSAHAVIRAVSAGEATVGVLPMPQPGEADPWWPSLVSRDGEAPRVVARLPFGPPGNARTNGADALVIGFAPQHDTGADRTLFAAETATGISRDRIIGSLADLGLACTLLLAEERPCGPFALLELDGFVEPGDGRLAGFAGRLGRALHRLAPLGGYARPLSLPAADAPGLAAAKG